MDLVLIERLMQMLEKSEVDTLEVTEGNLHIRLSKSPDRAKVGVTTFQRPTAIPQDQHSGLTTIVAGLSGTFYRAPSPGVEPFVREGSLVAEGDRLALIEAMKMLNPVEAEAAGTIRRVLLADGTPVAPGTPLFAFEKAAS